MKYRTIRRNCIVCGKEFNIKIRNSDNKIMTRCFFCRLTIGSFPGWTCEPKLKFKNILWKIIGYTKIQRKIVDAIWKYFNYRKFEYWECPKCWGNEIVHYEYPKGRYRCNRAVGKGKPEKLTKDWNKVTCQNCINWRKPK